MGGIDHHLNIPRRFFKHYSVASALAAVTTITVGISQDEEDTYGPFNFIYVVNNAAQKISLIPDGDVTRKMMVPATTLLMFSDVDFRNLACKNEDTANATDDTVDVHVIRDIGLREFLMLQGKTLRTALVV